MKKFTFKGVLDGFRANLSSSSSSQSTSQLVPSSNVKEPVEIQESLRPENFTVAKTFSHGFPFQPTAIAYDAVQRHLAIGCKSGSLRIFGRPGVDIHTSHQVHIDGNSGLMAVLHLEFLHNEGGLISCTADDTLHLWDYKSKPKKPEIVNSLKFQRERVTCLFQPFQSKWLYVGTDRGNIHVVNIDTFQLSGYVINWNKAIEITRKTHPGSIVYLGDNPTDPSKLLIGYDSGQVVHWDLKQRAADFRCQTNEPLTSISWHSDGKSFMCSHTDGSLTTWTTNRGVTAVASVSSGPSQTAPKPVSIIFPHARTNGSQAVEPCKMIQRVEWKSSKTGENYVIFSGGLPSGVGKKNPASISVIHGKVTTVLEMEHNVLDFIVMCDSQYESELQDPFGIIVLLQQDLVVIDLTTPGYPCFENPYAMDIHESPVTACHYIVDCPGDIIPALYSVGSKLKGTGSGMYSERDWPIDGGQWGSDSCSYAELILTGHADGSIKFWDATCAAMQSLYKLKTSKPFEKESKKRGSGAAGGSQLDSDPFAVQSMILCADSRQLLVAGASSQILVYKFKRSESPCNVKLLEIPIIDPANDVLSAAGFDFCLNPEGASNDYFYPIRIKDSLNLATTGETEGKKLPAGFQVDIICLTPWVNGEPPGSISFLDLNTSFGLIAYGNDFGIVVVDTIGRTLLLNMSLVELYNIYDPYLKAPRSPRLKELIAEEKSASPPYESSQQESPSKGPATSPNSRTRSLQQVVAASFGGDGSKGSTPEGGGGSVSGSGGSGPPRRTKSQGCSTPPSAGGSHAKLLSKCHSVMLGDQEGGGPGGGHSSFESIGEEAPLSTTVAPSRGSFLMSKQYYHSFGGGGAIEKPPPLPPQQHLLVASSSLGGGSEKLDGQFSRSRSSSMSSLDNLSTEAIQYVFFAESFPKKGEYLLQPILFVGTTVGSILSIGFPQVIPAEDERDFREDVSSYQVNSLLKMKGSVVYMNTLDYQGNIIQHPSTTWRDTAKNKEATSKLTPSSSGAVDYPTLVQYLVAVSEKSAKVIQLPSQYQVSSSRLSEESNTFVIKACLTNIKESSCLIVYQSSGQLTIYSIPYLKVLFIAEDFLPLTDLSFHLASGSGDGIRSGNARNCGLVDPMLNIWGQQLFVNDDTKQIAKTFCLHGHGHGMYLSSPSEIQKYTVSDEFFQKLSSLLGELYMPCEMPERKDPQSISGFFTGLFGGGVRNLDREELFGESASGKAPRSVAKQITPGQSTNPQHEHLKMRSDTLAGVMSQNRMMLEERGQKLSQVEDKTAKMMNDAENFSSAAHQLMLKYKDKKWYQL